MALRKYIGTVSTNKVGSECDFEFEVDDEELPAEKNARADALEKIASEALWGSGMIDWSFEEKGS